jgi:hypothetical protein
VPLPIPSRKLVQTIVTAVAHILLTEADNLTMASKLVDQTLWLL